MLWYLCSLVSSGLSGAISGGAEQLFGKQKARGIEAVLNRVTVVLAVLFFVLTIGVKLLKFIKVKEGAFSGLC